MTQKKPDPEVKRPSGKFALRMPRSLHDQLLKAAEEDGVSANQFIVATLAARIGEPK